MPKGDIKLLADTISLGFRSMREAIDQLRVAVVERNKSVEDRLDRVENSVLGKSIQ
jgi:hypothetical protein